jgi:anti-sigma factor RsiW
MSGCEERIPALVDLSEGALDGASRAELEAHLAGCAPCQAELATLCEGTSLAVTTRAEAHPVHLSGLAPRVAAEAERLRDGTWRGLWWSTTRGVRLALGASLASLALAIGLAASTLRAPHVPEATDDLASTDLASTDLASTALASHDDASTTDDSLAYETGFDALSMEELETLEQLLD